MTSANLRQLTEETSYASNELNRKWIVLSKRKENVKQQQQKQQEHLFVPQRKKTFMPTFGFQP